jgi:Cu-Zn family superoxide dismutase
MRRRLLLISAATLLAAPVAAQEAIGTFIDTDGNQVGAVSLAQQGDTVVATGEIVGISPGPHGIHYHAVGDCDPSTAFESAGPHFNPANEQHGLDNPEGPHFGDLPNLIVGADGIGAISLSNVEISLVEPAEGYLFDDDGTALVIHADEDDQITDPSGNSGDRIACAVIEAPPAQ